MNYMNMLKMQKKRLFKKGILIELFHRQIDDKDIHEIINSLKMSELELEQSQNDILKKHRFKEIDLSFKVIQDFFIELVKEYKKLGMKYCRDTILSK